MTRLLSQRKSSAAAYSLLDLSELDEDLRKDIIEDAHAGGGVYGIRVVEESVNGPARAPIYGVYKEGPDADRWSDAKKELGISGSEIDDSEVYAGVGSRLVPDERREALLREQAAQRAEAEADAIRSGERAAVEEIAGEGSADLRIPAPAPSIARMDHPINQVDPTLDPNATNEAANAENQEPSAAPAKPKTKTPK